MLNHTLIRYRWLASIFSLLSSLVFISGVSASTNFVARGADGRIDCEQVAIQCESWRSQLFKKWHRSSDVPWNPRCEVVIHFSRASYTKHVGAGSGQTNGCSLIKLSEGAVVQRRIDLLADSNGRLTALPHELTHVVLADLFGGRKPPPWLDEGIATLVDSDNKRSLHHRDCREAIDSGIAFRVAELLTLERLSHPGQVAAFYGQSLSLTQFLIDRNEPHDLVHFVRHAMEVGYDRAIEKHYGYETMADLETDWRNFARTIEAFREGQPSGEMPLGEPFVKLVQALPQE